jgi:hypothetical protein
MKEHPYLKGLLIIILFFITTSICFWFSVGIGLLVSLIFESPIVLDNSLEWNCSTDTRDNLYGGCFPLGMGTILILAFVLWGLIAISNSVSKYCKRRSGYDVSREALLYA